MCVGARALVLCVGCWVTGIPTATAAISERRCPGVALLKDTPRAGLIKAIEGTVNGQTFVDPSVAGKLFTPVSGKTMAEDTTVAAELSPRERDVLRYLARGPSNAEIGERLFLSEGIVRNYVSSILTKLGVTDRTQAAIIALRHGLAVE